MRNLEARDFIDTPKSTSRRSLFRKALAAAAAVAGAGALLDVSKRPARAADGDPLTVGNTALLGPDTSSNTTQLDKDNLNAGPTLVLTNQNGDGLVSSGAANSAGVSGLGESGPNSTGVFGRASAVGVYGQGPTGVLGTGGPRGVEGQGVTTGVLGRGTGAGSQGVAGRSDAANSTGVRGDGAQFGVVGLGLETAVFGFGGQRGVEGQGNQVGVFGVGTGAGNDGVRGLGQGANSTGVRGQGTFQGVLAEGRTFGVQGVSTAAGSNGVFGFSDAADSIGVRGEGAVGVRGTTTVANGTGVLCQGNFVATGMKSAAVAHPDGSHRLLYCMESPESWFEDFGRGVVAGGRASVALEPDFAAVVHTTDYHVFLTPEGDSRGLYVSSKSATGFTVHEQQGGTSSLAFSYRVVARRKDVAAERLAKFSLPATPSPTDFGSAAEPTQTPDLQPLKPSQISAPPPAGSRRR